MKVSCARLCAGILLVIGHVAASFGQFEYDPEAASEARQAFVDEMVRKHGFDRAQLSAMLVATVIDQSILDAISRPAERVVPWYEYRQIFVTPDRIAAGVQFWRTHATTLSAAAQRFGVDEQMIVAIIGIESRFGERMGRYRVLDALSTLAFAYPPRAAFFRSELESFLLLGREERTDLSAALGSYAGAMGAGQFIPSSYRAYAVDGDDDGRRDLWSNWNDIVASVANYFSEHGWRYGEVAAVRATRSPTSTAAHPSNRLELSESVGSLIDAGYRIEQNLPSSAAAAVYAFEQDQQSFEHWLGLHNFFVITRYNRSHKYALAAVQLSHAIREQYQNSPGVAQ